MTNISKPDFKIKLLREASDFIRNLDKEAKKHVYLNLERRNLKIIRENFLK